MLRLILIVEVIAFSLFCAGSNASAFDQSDDFFPIMPWDGHQGWNLAVKGFNNPLESVAECNFTMAGFVQPKDLPVCEKLGLKAIVECPPELEQWKVLAGESDGTIERLVKQWVSDAGKSSSIFGYYVKDEPGSPLFPALSEVVKSIGKYAPGKLAYINLFPGYATIGAPDKSQLGAANYTEYLESFVAKVKPQFLSYDNYKIITSYNLQNRTEGASYFKDILEVRRISQEHGIPFWNVVCANRIRPHTTVPSPANMLLQAYTTLAAGGRGLAWYTYYDQGYGYAPIDGFGNRTDTYYYLQMVNRQVKVLGPIMNRLKSIGVYFTDLSVADGIPYLPGKLVERVESRASLKGNNNTAPSIMIGEFEGNDGGDYVMLVNLSLEKSANIIIHTRKAYSAKNVISAQDGLQTPIDEVNGHWLVPGQGVLVKLVR